MDYLDSDKVWSLDQKYGHPLGLLGKQNLRLLSRSTKSETLGARLRNAYFTESPK